MRYRHIINLFLVSTPICVLLRVIQLMFTIDGDTGFIKQQYSAISLLITLIVCATIAAVSMLAASVEGINKNQIKSNVGMAVIGVVTGGTFIYQALTNVLGKNTSAWHDALLAVLCLLAALVFIAYGLRNIYQYKMPQITLIIPVVYYVVRLINLFVSTSSLALITENVFLVFTNSVLLWFLFEFASFENEIGDVTKKPKKLFASGIASVMFCAVTALPKVVLLIKNNDKVSGDNIASVLLNIAMGLFVCIYIMSNFREKNTHTPKPKSKHSA